jgi:hypothetical protein
MARYPTYYHRTLNAVIADSESARSLVAVALRNYRRDGKRLLAQEFLRHVIWVGYPGKRISSSKRNSIKEDLSKVSC